MNKTNKVISFNNKELDFDDIICVLNPVQSCDLKQILLMTPENRRLDVAMAYSGLSKGNLFEKSGINYVKHNGYRWLNHEMKLPLGVAFRLAKVFGVSVEILFAAEGYRNDHK